MNYRASGNGIRRRGAGGARFARLAAAGLLAALSANVAGSSPASADLWKISCGAPNKSYVRVKFNEEQTIASTAFVNVTGALTTINIPAGQSKCVRVRFSANLICDPPNGGAHCYIKVEDSLHSGAFAPTVSIATDEPGGTHSYEWANRLSEGSHKIRVKAAADSGVAFNIARWTLAIEVAD